jgi:hypothetical protein
MDDLHAGEATCGDGLRPSIRGYGLLSRPRPGEGITVDSVVTLEELLEQIRTLPLNLASVEHGADEDHVEDDVAAAVAELAVAATIARVAQESLRLRVEIARSRGATWTTVGKLIGLTPWRAQQRYFEKRPFGARW